MSSRGQTAMVGFMIAFLLIITVIVLIEPLKGIVSWGRAPGQMDCGNASISVGNQMACIVMDMMQPAYIGIGLAVAIAYMGLKEKVSVS